MKFLIDENAGQSVIAYLKQKGHDVLVARETPTIREDYLLLERAYQEERIIITNDKDFGFLIYRERRPSYGVILFRFKLELPKLKIAALEKILELDTTRVLHHFIVVSEGKIRLRKLL